MEEAGIVLTGWKYQWLMDLAQEANDQMFLRITQMRLSLSKAMAKRHQNISLWHFVLNIRFVTLTTNIIHRKLMMK